MPLEGGLEIDELLSASDSELCSRLVGAAPHTRYVVSRMLGQCKYLDLSKIRRSLRFHGRPDSQSGMWRFIRERNNKQAPR